MPTSHSAPEEIYYGVKTENQLFGFQLGGRGEYYLTCRLAMNFGHKVGLYGNHIEHESVIGGSAGLAMINNGPNYGRYFYVENSKDDLSLLGELLVGLSYQCHSPLGHHRRVSFDRSNRHGPADQSDLFRSARH